MVGRWLGLPGGECVTVIDTPGLADTRGRSSTFTDEIGKAVTSLGEIDLFLLLINSGQPRFTDYLKTQLEIFNNLFGADFWKKVTIQLTYWAHDRRSRRTRKKHRRTEDIIAENWKEILRENFHVMYDVPVTFVDSVVDAEWADPEELEIFRKETQKILQATKGNPAPFLF